MNCVRARELLHPDADGELDAANALDLERHAEVCPRCGAARERLRTLRAVVATAPYHRAPPGLARDVRAALGLDSVTPPVARRHVSWWRGLAIAASLLIAATLAVGAWRIVSRPGTADPLVAELVSAHVRSMMADHLLDVPSSDRHTVKPWFAGRVDFSPAVRDLSAEGFPLAGGRLDYINGRAVAVLVYRRDQHVINCFTWPAAGEAPPRVSTTNGYSVVTFTHAGQAWHLVSDASAATLEELGRALRETP